MMFCPFCHWTKVEPGNNCPKCNTYMPKSPSIGHDTREPHVRRPARAFDTLMVLIDARGTDLGKDERRPRNFFFEGESRGKDRPSEGLSGKR